MFLHLSANIEGPVSVWVRLSKVSCTRLKSLHAELGSRVEISSLDGGDPEFTLSQVNLEAHDALPHNVREDDDGTCLLLFESGQRTDLFEKVMLYLNLHLFEVLHRRCKRAMVISSEAKSTCGFNCLTLFDRHAKTTRLTVPFRFKLPQFYAQDLGWIEICRTTSTASPPHSEASTCEAHLQFLSELHALIPSTEKCQLDITVPL